jgi:hypothetical protein
MSIHAIKRYSADVEIVTAAYSEQRGIRHSGAVLFYDSFRPRSRALFFGFPPGCGTNCPMSFCLSPPTGCLHFDTTGVSRLLPGNVSSGSSCFFACTYLSTCRRLYFWRDTYPSTVTMTERAEGRSLVSWLTLQKKSRPSESRSNWAHRIAVSRCPGHDFHQLGLQPTDVLPGNTRPHHPVLARDSRMSHPSHCGAPIQGY